jgi:hypothetical protein
LNQRKIFIKDKWERLKNFILSQGFVNITSLILSALAAVYGVLSYNFSVELGKDREQINTLTSLVNESQKLSKEAGKQTNLIIQQHEVLKKIAISIDSTNKASQNWNRKAVILVSADIKESEGKYYVERICFKNVGKIECEIKFFAISLPKNFYCWPDSLRNKKRFFELAYRQKDTYRYLIEEMTVRNISVNRPVCVDFDKDLSFTSKKELIMSYTLTYGNILEDNTINGMVKMQILKD